MNRQNLELFGLSEGASWEEVEAAYNQLHAKLSEDRFLDGEEGNAAARRLTQIEVAYDELKTEYAERATSYGGDNSEESSNVGSAFTRVEECI